MKSREISVPPVRAKGLQHLAVCFAFPAWIVSILLLFAGGFSSDKFSSITAIGPILLLLACCFCSTVSFILFLSVRGMRVFERIVWIFASAFPATVGWAMVLIGVLRSHHP